MFVTAPQPQRRSLERFHAKITGQDSKTKRYRISLKGKLGYISNEYVKMDASKVPESETSSQGHGNDQLPNAKTWSAFEASKKGQAFYKSKGFKTTRTVFNGVNHHAYDLASVMKQGLKTGGL